MHRNAPRLHIQVSGSAETSDWFEKTLDIQSSLCGSTSDGLSANAFSAAATVMIPVYKRL